MRLPAGLYAVADTGCVAPARLLDAVHAAIEGGARVVQYRDKTGDSGVRAQQARALATLCRETATLFLVNDDVQLAQDVNADGVHLGRDDATPAAARARLGATAMIGVSCYDDLARALAAQAQGVDYVALGSFFPSRTKPQAARASADLLRAARAALSIPIVAIGGITPENGADLLHAGADSLAVITGLFEKTDVRAAATQYAALFEAPR